MLASASRSHLTFLTTERGAPFTSNGLGNWFRQRCDEASLPHCSAHGLRKAAATRLADQDAARTASRPSQAPYRCAKSSTTPRPQSKSGSRERRWQCRSGQNENGNCPAQEPGWTKRGVKRWQSFNKIWRLEHLRNCHVGTIWHERNHSEHDTPIASVGAAKKVPDRVRGASAREAKKPLHRACRGPAGFTVRRWRRGCPGEQRGLSPKGRPYPNCSMSLRFSGRVATVTPSLPVSGFGPKRIPARR